VPLFNAPLLPAPPLPPENIMTEQDRQTQIHYEQWLNHQNQIVTSQLKYYETEVSKLRKIRKVSSPKSLCCGKPQEFTITIIIIIIIYFLFQGIRIQVKKTVGYEMFQ
jgi:hypothetical protein